MKNNYGLGGTLVSAGIGAYLGAKNPSSVQKVTDPIDKAVSDIASNFTDDKSYAKGGSVDAKKDGPFSVEVWKTKARYSSNKPSIDKEVGSYADALEVAMENIDKGAYKSQIMSASGYLWEADKNGVKEFKKGGMTDSPATKIGKVKFSIAKGEDFDIEVSEGKYRLLREKPFDLPTQIIDMNRGKNFDKMPVNDSPIAKKYQKEIQEFYNDDMSRFAKGGEIKDGGRYLNIVSGKNKLTITPTKEGLEEIKEQQYDDISDMFIMEELFEDIRGNSELDWHYDLGEVGFGLTSASGMTDGYYYDDDGEYTDKGHKDSRVYYFKDYMYRSEIDDLLDGELVLEKVQDTFEKGGSIGDISGNYFSSTDFVKSNNLMPLAKKTFGEDWESGGDYDYDNVEIEMLVKRLGGGYKVVYVDSDRQNRDNFEAAKQKYFPKMDYNSNDGVLFVVRTRDASTYKQGGDIDGDNGYIAFYKGKKMEVYADSSLHARDKAAKLFKAKKSYDVRVVLAEKDGKQVIHNAYFSEGGKISVYDERNIRQGKKKISIVMLENEKGVVKSVMFADDIQKQYNRNKQEDIDKLWELSNKVPYMTIIDKNYKFEKGGEVDYGNRTTKDFKLGELVYDTSNKRYGTIIGIYDEEGYEVRLDSDGMQPTEFLRKLGEKGDVGTKKQLFEGVASIERLIRVYPENNYPEIINNPFYKKGGEISTKGNEMLIGGLFGIALGIFLNK